MSNYDDDQSEDGELARSPVQDEMDFSLSDEDRDHADDLVIKPPQAVLRPMHKDRRGHKKSTKERYKDSSRKEKKHLFRDRDRTEKTKKEVREDIPKDYYRDKQYYREKDVREKETYREKALKEKEVYREKDVFREKDILEKDLYRDKEVYREKDVRDRDMYRDKDAYREREHYRERELYRETGAFREAPRQRDAFKEKDASRDREAYLARETQIRYTEIDRKQRKESARIESMLRLLADDGHPGTTNEKEIKEKSAGDKELEDLRSRLLSKRISKELQSRDMKRSDSSSESKEIKTEKNAALDRHQQERRKKLLEAEREMEKRKQESRNELEARREERRRRGKKRSVSPDESSNKKNKVESSPMEEDSEAVVISDGSDLEMKSDSAHSEPEEGEHSKSDTEDDSSDTDTNSEADSKSEHDNEDADEAPKSDQDPDVIDVKDKPRNTSKTPQKLSNHGTPSSHESRRSHSRSKSRSRSRSHSFSPPPAGQNGRAEPAPAAETSEEAKKREEEINALPPYFPALQGCRSVEEFQCLNRIEEGTYGVVYRARDKTTEEIVALKRLKMEKEKEGFPITSLREINTLLKGQHPNIVTCREIVVGSNMDKIFIVMDYVEHDLKSLMETMRAKKQVFLPGEVKCLMTQLLKAVHHLHDNWILHRDLKTSNLLLSHKGVLKVGDFGLAREYGSPLRAYTPVVVTLWYRAPELLLCGKEYSTPIDMWSVGCIFAEFVTMNALFPGKSEVDQLNRIFKDLGTPSESIWPGYSQLPAVQKMTFAEHPAGGLQTRVGPDLLSEAGQALLAGLLAYDPERRLAADAALDHAYFKEQPTAIDPAMFPTWPAKSEGRARAAHSPRPPAGGAAYSQAADARAADAAPGFRVQPQRSISVAPGFSLKF